MRGLVTTLIIAEVTGIATAALVVVIFDFSIAIFNCSDTTSGNSVTFPS